jgi:1-acyl-sn-glycerol-3-phosphate acyltransferase
MRTVLRTLIEALFRVLFTYDCLGEEKLPTSGPAVVASNHPSYLDPLLLSLQVRRPIRFMAWDSLFKVPVLGGLLRAFGAFPVDIRRGQGRAAYEKAKILIESGEIVGLFPEGRRSRAGWMEPTLREGAARLSFETGAPLVPATITGAFRAWPYFHVLPRPVRITVRYHDAIDPAAYRDQPEEQAVPALLDELRQRVERSLLPGVKADLRTELLYRSSAPGPRFHEYGPAFALALLVFWKTRSLWPVVPAYAYIAYLLLDQVLIPQRRFVKWVRNASPVFFILIYAYRVALPTLGLPAVAAPGALLAVLCGAFFAYLYERSRVTLGFIRGLVLAMCFGLGALYLVPTGIGPHISLTVFAAAYGWERRAVFWRYAAPVLLLYDVLVARWLHAGLEVLPHVVAGLLAWFFVRFLPDGSAVVEEAEPPPTHTSLGLS